MQNTLALILKFKKKIWGVKLGIFCLELGKKTILFGIGNGAEFRPQNRVMESPEKRGDDYNSCYFDRALSVNFNFSFQTI